jgi:FHA domain
METQALEARPASPQEALAHQQLPGPLSLSLTAFSHPAAQDQRTPQIQNPQKPILLVAPPPGALLSSREKVSVLTKKVLLYLYFRNKTIFDIQKLLPILGGEFKKVLEVLFALEGIGWIMRLNKNMFIFTGFEGMINRFHEYVAFKKAELVAKDAAAKEVKNAKQAEPGVPTGAPPAEVEAKPKEDKGDDEAPEEKKSTFRTFNKYETIQIQDKQIQVLPYELLADLAGTIVFELLLSANKVYPKKLLEEKFDKMVTDIKDGNFKPNLHDFQKLLEALGLVDTTENNTSALWVGPDCINITGITMANIKTIRNIEDVVVDHYRQYRTQFPTETTQRESSFLLSVYHVLTTQDVKGGSTERLLRSCDADCFQEYSKIPRFDKIGFCALKNKNFSYVVTKPSVIIGATKKARGDEQFSWTLDIDLFPDPFVSKQHALLMFNFQTEKWEIRCLSATNPIKVKDRILTEREEPRMLDENCFIRIGKQTIWFSLQQEEEANNEDLEEA